MGSFANTLFSALLGWVQTAASWVWQLFAAGGAQGMMGWLVDHWLMLVIALCAAGVTIDLVVYIFRWQPYRVWRSRRQRAEDEPAPQEEQEPLQWLYANGVTVTQEPEAQLAYAQTPVPDMQREAPVQPRQRVIPARRRRAADGSAEYVLPTGESVRQAYHQPYYPPQWHYGEQHTTDGGTNP
ncbi:MAG: hypothetical protein IJ343_10410 [Clostridia bacterium]|nr:hypothetical protein [Clostridia bacterium]